MMHIYFHATSSTRTERTASSLQSERRRSRLCSGRRRPHSRTNASFLLSVRKRNRRPYKPTRQVRERAGKMYVTKMICTWRVYIQGNKHKNTCMKSEKYNVGNVRVPQSARSFWWVEPSHRSAWHWSEYLKHVLSSLAEERIRLAPGKKKKKNLESFLGVHTRPL